MAAEARAQAGADSPTLLSPASELVSFAAGLPDWQADLIRRIYEHGGALDADIEDALVAVRASAGLPVDRPPATARPLRSADIPALPQPLPVKLAALGPLASVNRLDGTQPLRFGLAGLSVVYGENGTGKSGYCRVLKSISRARGADEEVLSDVFADTPGTPKAQVHYNVGDAAAPPFEWAEGGAAPPDELSAITVFDARRAPLYCDAGRRLEFLPRGLDVLPEFARALGLVASRIDGELALARRALVPVPVTPSAGQVAVLLARLEEGRVLPSEDEIAMCAALSTQDTAALGALEDAAGTDPIALAGRLDALAGLLDRLAEAAAAAECLLGVSGVEAMRGNLAALRELGAVDQDERISAPGLLPETGSEAWRTMFNAAREYMATALPETSFPDPADGAVCPLCQQVLSGAAHERLDHFDVFVRSSIAARLGQLRLTLQQMLDDLTALNIPDREDLNSLLLAKDDEPGLEDFATSLAESFDGYEGQRVALLNTRDTATTDVPDAPDPVSGRITARADALRNRAQQLRTRPPEFTPTELAQLAELQSRRAMAGAHASIIGRREQLLHIAALSRCRSSCDTTAISRKGSELRDRYISADFNARFHAELRRLGLGYLPVRQASRTERGESHVSVALDATSRTRAREVLSDGEMRGMALAGFLADASRIGGDGPMVLDDPVSSLDHHRVRAVAERLVEEAKKRQVIVLTHSIVLLREMWALATSEEVPAICNWLYVDGSIIGKIREDQVPWDAAGVRERLGELDRQLAHMRKRTDGASDEYRLAVKGFYGSLRDSWERLVEELLLNSVMNRYLPDVQTQRLHSVEVTDNDYTRIWAAMKRASDFEHDRPAAGSIPQPRPDEMAQDLERLRCMCSEISQRLKLVEKRRKDLVQRPPAAQMGA